MATFNDKECFGAKMWNHTDNNNKTKMQTLNSLSDLVFDLAPNSDAFTSPLQLINVGLKNVRAIQRF